MKNCFFCENQGGQILYNCHLYRIVLINDKDYPGFLQLIVDKHIKELTDLSFKENLTLYKALINCENIIRKYLNPDKINLASLGNVTPHIHWHIIPRFSQDKHFPNPIWGEIVNLNYTPTKQLIENQTILINEFINEFNKN